MKAIITVGISASGKTTWAKEQKDYTVICRDDVRRQILESVLDRPLLAGELWSKWKWKHEPEVTGIVQLQIADAAAKGKNIIIADTNLIEKYRTMLVQKLEALGYEVTMRLFQVTYEEACKRDAARRDGVGHSVIMKQWLQYQNEFGHQKYEPNESLPKAVVCDLDGTLAHMNGKRTPFEWDKVHVDDVDLVVNGILTAYKERGYEIIILSGRDGVSRDMTHQWLEDHDIEYDYLFMRQMNDNRGDDIIKPELFNKFIRHKFNVECIIDDRPKVVRQWIAMGLKTITMGNPFIEF